MPLDAEAVLPKHECMTMDDLCLLCDMFYLPYQHGSRAVELLQELNWLVNFNPDSYVEEGDTTLPTEWTRKVLGVQASFFRPAWPRSGLKGHGKCYK